jgi:hypothetical protein
MTDGAITRFRFAHGAESSPDAERGCGATGVALIDGQGNQVFTASNLGENPMRERHLTWHGRPNFGQTGERGVRPIGG